MKKLKRPFFERPTLDVARDILGKFIVKDDLVGQINEVEAYVGDIDPACHAYRGVTRRNKVMFGRAGVSYVYFIYGMYFCFNIVTEKEGIGSAVLIRGVKPVRGIEKMKKRRKISDLKNLTSGPGKFCQAFDITRKHNGIDLCNCFDFYIADDEKKPPKIYSSKRIGINVGTELEWRFTADF